jgi:hypothetical protein
VRRPLLREPATAVPHTTSHPPPPPPNKGNQIARTTGNAGGWNSVEACCAALKAEFKWVDLKKCAAESVKRAGGSAPPAGPAVTASTPKVPEIVTASCYVFSAKSSECLREFSCFVFFVLLCVCVTLCVWGGGLFA